MSGSSVVVNLSISETDLDGSPGGAQLSIESDSVNVASAESFVLPLTDNVTPVVLQMPPGGARILGVKVLPGGTTAPTLTWTDALGTKSQQIDGHISFKNSISGPVATAASIKGIGRVRIFLGG